MGRMVNEIVGDARWFPLRFDVQRDEFHFAFIDAERHRQVAFLQEVRLEAADTRVVPRAEMRGVRIASSPLHLILHSGLGGSTLLARALNEPAVVITLQEPPILTDVIAYGLKSSASETRELLNEVRLLISRPFSPAEVVACKMSAIGNGLGAGLARSDARSQILCLQSPLEEMLSSFAARGIEGRMAARRLLIGLRNSHMLAFQMTDTEIVDHTDLQLAALAWLSMQKMMVGAAAEFGPERMASIMSAQLFENPRDTLLSVAKHFRLNFDVEARIAGGIFSHHAKTGESFDARQRKARTGDRLRIHGSEIEPIVTWAKKIAESAEIPWELPYPLLH